MIRWNNINNFYFFSYLNFYSKLLCRPQVVVFERKASLTQFVMFDKLCFPMKGHNIVPILLSVDSGNKVSIVTASRCSTIMLRRLSVSCMKESQNTNLLHSAEKKVLINHCRHPMAHL